MNADARTWIARADRLSLAGIALGIGVLLLPHEGALRAGFFLTLAATVAQIVFSHLRAFER